MAYLWIYDATNDETLNLDSICRNINLGGNKRSFDIVEFAGADGGYVKGYGNYSPKTYKIGRIEYKEAGDVHFWNSRRDDCIKFFTKPPYVSLYLYMKNGENDATYRTPIVCTDIADLDMKNMISSGDYLITLVAYEGFLTKTTATTDSLSITSSSAHILSITNNGLIECAPTFNFTPTGTEESYAVKLGESYGFLLEGTFTAGYEISYNMGTGVLSIGGAMVSLSNYLTKGSRFKIPSGTYTIYITCSGPGSFDYEFYERKI